ncbi:hypothetical protein DPX16_13398 [Anabarilius grahami]|uniref:Uncharacterized protein n=1 Tax=Anabarilius grahami TaxID=495550 RepID=A0A3N0YNA9_ANAGA|nr:hypothetical protein DPX16_13398 [Anabarilius grahami]
MRFQGLSLTAGLPRDANCELTASISCDEMDIYNEWSPGTSAQAVMLYEFTKSEPAAKMEIIQKVSREPPQHEHSLLWSRDTRAQSGSYLRTASRLRPQKG